MPTIGNHDSILSHLPLLLGEPLGIMGPIREKKEGNNGNQNGGCSLDKEEPLPGVQLKESVHIVENSCGEET